MTPSSLSVVLSSPPAFTLAPFPVLPLAIPGPLPSQTTGHAPTHRGGPLRCSGALQLIPGPSLPSPSDVSTHSSGQCWKSWLSDQVDHNGQLQNHQESLHIIAPDICTATELIWSYLLHVFDPTPLVVNPEQCKGISIKFSTVGFGCQEHWELEHVSSIDDSSFLQVI